MTIGMAGGFIGCPDLQHETDGLAIRIGQRNLVVTQLLSPVRIGAPGRRLQHGADAALLRDRQVAVDPATFSRLFRRKVSLTPAEYRRWFGSLRKVLQTAGQ
jgi:methylphosphotriester-DNA--protein-cysteine methyltransferase